MAIDPSYRPLRYRARRARKLRRVLVAASNAACSEDIAAFNDWIDTEYFNELPETRRLSKQLAATRVSHGIKDNLRGVLAHWRTKTEQSISVATLRSQLIGLQVEFASRANMASMTGETYRTWWRGSSSFLRLRCGRAPVDDAW